MPVDIALAERTACPSMPLMDLLKLTMAALPLLVSISIANCTLLGSAILLRFSLEFGYFFLDYQECSQFGGVQFALIDLDACIKNRPDVLRSLQDRSDFRGVRKFQFKERAISCVLALFRSVRTPERHIAQMLPAQILVNEKPE